MTAPETQSLGSTGMEEEDMRSQGAIVARDSARPDRPLSAGGSATVRTCVDADLRAFHTDPINDPSINEGRHEHVWNVQLVYEGEVFRDARCFRAALLNVLAQYDGQDLPWWSGEDMARAFLCIGTGDPIGCVVSRPGYRAEAWR